jgi:uncharacterized membrane protein YphA (DoxX/SURF4 family)
MRLAAGISLILEAAGVWPSGASTVATGFSLLSLATALLLLLGLWTPFAGVLAAVAAAWHGMAAAVEPVAFILLGVLGLALALLGPGAWSIDARLFGWKRVEIQNGTNGDSWPGDSAPHGARIRSPRRDAPSTD